MVSLKGAGGTINGFSKDAKEVGNREHHTQICVVFHLRFAAEKDGRVFISFPIRFFLNWSIEVKGHFAVTQSSNAAGKTKKNEECRQQNPKARANSKSTNSTLSNKAEQQQERDIAAREAALKHLDNKQPFGFTLITQQNMILQSVWEWQWLQANRQKGYKRIDKFNSNKAEQQQERDIAACETALKHLGIKQQFGYADHTCRGLSNPYYRCKRCFRSNHWVSWIQRVPQVLATGSVQHWGRCLELHQVKNQHTWGKYLFFGVKFSRMDVLEYVRWSCDNLQLNQSSAASSYHQQPAWHANQPPAPQLGSYNSDIFRNVQSVTLRKKFKSGRPGPAAKIARQQKYTYRLQMWCIALYSRGDENIYQFNGCGGHGRRKKKWWQNYKIADTDSKCRQPEPETGPTVRLGQLGCRITS